MSFCASTVRMCVCHGRGRCASCMYNKYRVCMCIFMTVQTSNIVRWMDDVHQLSRGTRKCSLLSGGWGMQVTALMQRTLLGNQVETYIPHAHTFVPHSSQNVVCLCHASGTDGPLACVPETHGSKHASCVYELVSVGSVRSGADVQPSKLENE